MGLSFAMQAKSVKTRISLRADERRSRGVRMMLNTFNETEEEYSLLRDYML